MEVTSPRTLRILHVVPSRGFSGVEQHVSELVEALPHHSMLCSVATGPNPVLEARLRLSGQSTIVLPLASTFDMRYLLALLRLVRRERTHVLHTHLGSGQLFGVITGLMLRIPVIHTQHFIAPGFERASITR